jgi:hypothetical protein
MSDAGHKPADDARHIDDELDAIQLRLRTLRDRLDAFEPWDHQASAARLHAARFEAEQGDRPRG